jgi:hypothetical protein
MKIGEKERIFVSKYLFMVHPPLFSPIFNGRGGLRGVRARPMTDDYSIFRD